jgi:hypothetical protein
MDPQHWILGSGFETLLHEEDLNRKISLNPDPVVVQEQILQQKKTTQQWIFLSVLHINSYIRTFKSIVGLGSNTMAHNG